MSQKVRIHSVKVEGHVYLDEGRWSRSAAEVMAWLCDGWRGLFNNFRQQREWRGQRHETVEPLTQSQYRSSAEYRRALPTCVLQGTEKAERVDWVAALRRIKTTKSGNVSRFKRRKEGLSFRALGNGYTEAVRLSKNRGEVVISGRNPSGMYGPGDTLGWKVRIRFRWSQDIRPYTSVTVNWSRGTMSFVNSPEPLERLGDGVVGIDVGVAQTITTSDGRHLSIPRATKSETARHKQLQRKLARQDCANETRGGREAKFSSRRRQRTLDQINRLASKQARRRKDWVDKVTTELVRHNSVIVLEDLSSKSMSAKGGRHKVGLNRGIRESCWGMLQGALQYKADLAGTKVICVNPAYTSQMCNKCGHIARENRESQAAFRCVQCGHTANADVNAAKNIRDIGLGRSLGRGAEVRPAEASLLADAGAGCEASTLVLAVSA